MKYAVISILGFQYLAKEQDVLDVLGVHSKTPNIKVLLYSDGQNVMVDPKSLQKIKLSLSIVNKEVKGKKIEVYKYKSKSRYRKHLGFRPVFTKMKVESIG